MLELRIATRTSPLAVWQAEHVAALLRVSHPDLRTTLVRMRTEGDKLLDAPLARVGGKGLFVKALETAMLEGRADIAVHSMKDVPAELPSGLHLPVVLERADPRDALVSRGNLRLAELRPGAVLGTASLRRRCQLAALRPDCRVVTLRGNVQTRLGKLEAGHCDATVLALSGLERLGVIHLVSEVLPPESMLPAIGQGALGIECRAQDEPVNELLQGLQHRPTAWCVAAERAVNARIGGGCQAPIAAFAQLDESGQRLAITARVFSLDGRRVLTESGEGALPGAAELGAQVAEGLLAQGASALLEETYAALDAEDETQPASVGGSGAGAAPEPRVDPA